MSSPEEYTFGTGWSAPPRINKERKAELADPVVPPLTEKIVPPKPSAANSSRDGFIGPAPDPFHPDGEVNTFG